MVRAGGAEWSFAGLCHAWGGGMQLQTRNEPERDHLPRTEKAKAEAQRGGLSSLFSPGGIQCDEFSARASATL